MAEKIVNALKENGLKPTWDEVLIIRGTPRIIDGTLRSKMAQAKKTVMFVNSDPLIYGLFRAEMEDEFKDEVKTIYFDDCDAAFDYLDSNKVDVVVSSVAFHKLPFGYHFMRFVKARFPELPFIFFTGWPFREYPHPADYFLQASSDTRELLDTVRKCL